MNSTRPDVPAAPGDRDDRRSLLSDVAILDLSQNAVGQAATIALGDLGADVISLTRPGYGAARGFSRTMTVGRNLRSIVVDLKSPRGMEIFKRLVLASDVIVEGFRPGVADRLGIDEAAVRQIRNDIIYCSVSGYGQTGPYATHPGHDLNYQGVAGALPMDHAGSPTMPTNNWADRCATLNMEVAILAALLSRKADGRGSSVDLSITDTMLTFPADEVYGHADYYRVLTGAPPGSEAPPTSFLRGEHPGYQVYECADGSFLALGCIEPWFWERICQFLDRPEWADLHEADDPRHAEIFDFLRATFKQRVRSEWLNRLIDLDVPASPVNTGSDVFTDPQLQARGVVAETHLPNGDRMRQIKLPFQISTAETRIRRPPAPLGADTRSILADLGYREEDIEAALQQGIIEENS